MFWNGLLGNAATVDRLRESVRRGRLAHTYAFVGPAGVGKKRCALMLAQCLLCQRHEEPDFDACGECPGCRQVMAHMHPDLLIVERPKESSVLPIKLFIGEGDTRGKEGLCHDLALRPMAGRRRIGIIDEAELLTIESGNALLKTLEEPPDYAVLI